LPLLMIGTYASAALICAASLLVGRALLSVAGRRSWSWLEPAVGLAAVLTVTGVLARAPGHGTSATLGVVVLVIVAALVPWWVPYEAPGALRMGWPVAIVVLLALSIPFAVSGRWGLLGVGFNNDLGLHLAWAEWLRSGFGPTPEAGYPLGPHGLAVATAAFPGIGLGQAFIGEILAIGVLTGLTALGALRDLGAGRRALAAALVALTYLAASYFAQAAFKETAEALFVLAFAIYLATISTEQTRAPASPGNRTPSPDTQQRAQRAVSGEGVLLPGLTLASGIFFSYSFAGLAWPIAILALWSLTRPAVRRALRPRSLLRFLLRPLTLLTIVVLGGLAVVITIVGPFGFAHGFNKVAGSNTYGPVSPIEMLGVWPAGNYRLDAAGGAQLPGLAGAIAALALLVGVAWWVRRREPALPVALGACAVLYLVSLPFSGDYSQAKALMIAAPLAMLVAIRPLLSEFPWAEEVERDSSEPPRCCSDESLSTSSRGRSGAVRVGWAVLAVLFVGGAVYSSLLVLRDAPVGPGGHGAELEAFLPVVHGKPVLYAGQDRYAAYELLGADTHVPLVEFPDPEVAANPEKPFDTGDAYSPIDFDSFSRGTLDRFAYVITGRAAWNSQAPPNFKRVAVTPSYVLWKRKGTTPENRHVLLEGTEAAALADCAAPEIRILFANPGRASLFPGAVIGSKADWAEGNVLGTGESASQSLDLPAGSWNLSLQYFSPFDLTLTAPGFREPLPAALDGQRPNTISLGNNGQFWPAGRYESKGGRTRFTLSTADAGTLQNLSGYDGKAYIGELVAVPAKPHRIGLLSAACNGWIDWYESPKAP
jgi:Ca2+/Na+ antiporter